MPQLSDLTPDERIAIETFLQAYRNTMPTDGEAAYNPDDGKWYTLGFILGDDDED